jgi:phosphoribosyl 1,2-cyclic phosphate phosphodiesterase
VRFLFLGTGTSAGIPAIGCDCPVCTSADPRDQRLRTAAALQFADPAGHPRTILLDAGPDLRQQALRARLSRCDAVFFTHNHVDHIFGLDEVRRFNAVMNRPIDIYADRHTFESLERIYQHIFERDKNVNDSFVATLVSHRVEPGTAIDLHGLRFTPFRLLHGKLPILGYRIDHARPQNAPPGSPLPLAYCTDVSGIPPETWGCFTGLRTLVLDALRHRRHPTHLTVEQAVNIADRVQADRTYFIHMTHDLAHAQTEAQLPDRMHLAYDGLVLGADSSLFGEAKPAPASDAAAH